MNTYLIGYALAAVAAVAGVMVCFRHKFVVQEGFVGLLYHAGRLTGALTAGSHHRWGRDYHLVSVDVRKKLMVVAGQEVLTADNVAVKASLVLTTELTDPLKVAREVDEVSSHLYSLAQVSIRVVVGGMSLDLLLTQKAALAQQLAEIMDSPAEALGVKVHKIEVRDIMLPADLRKAFSEILRAKHEGLAALERARGETAALRSLVNAARLMEGVPALTTLRFLQTLEASGQTVVLNDLSALSITKVK